MSLPWFLLFSSWAIWFLCRVSPTFKFYIKMAYVGFLFAFPSAVAIMFVPFFGKGSKNMLTASFVTRLLSWPLGIEWKIVDLRKTKSNSIYVANHQTMLDVIGLNIFYPMVHPVCVVMKKALLLTGPSGILWWLSGSVFIDRSKSDQAKAKMKKTLDDIQKSTSVFVYPEGTRNDSESILPFKSGAFYLAVQAQVPISPIVYAPYSEFFSYQEKRFDSGKLQVTFLPAIPTEGLTTADIPELVKKTRDGMIACYEKSKTKTE